MITTKPQGIAGFFDPPLLQIIKQMAAHRPNGFMAGWLAGRQQGRQNPYVWVDFKILKFPAD